MRLILGLGCRRGCSVDELVELAQAVLNEAGCEVDQLAALATLDTRLEEPGLQELARLWRLPLRGFPADHLATRTGTTAASAVALQHTGSPSIAEAAALLATGADARLLVSKRKSAAATAALAYA